LVGQLFLIVGNSGSGKDTILSMIKKYWPKNKPKIIIPRRYITRKKHPSENFHAISRQRFQRMKSQGKFSLTWESYGNYYGVSSKLNKWLEKGYWVLVNVSRSIIPSCKEQYSGCKVIYIHVPFKILENRIQKRGREKQNEQAYFERLKRAQENYILEKADITIDNSDNIEKAVEQVINFLYQY